MLLRGHPATITAVFVTTAFTSVAECFSTLPFVPPSVVSRRSISSIPTASVQVRGGSTGSAGINGDSRRSFGSTSKTLLQVTTTPIAVDEIAATTTTKTEASSVEFVIDDGSMTASEKLQAVRERMKALDLNVWLVPTDDPHLSEYVPDAYKRREFLTGFKGSAGTAVISADQALLWTDSRYWNEAGMQLDATYWTLQKSGLTAVPTIPKWLGDTAVKHYTETKKTLRIGMDPYVHAASFAKEVTTALEEAAKEAGLLEDDEATVPTIGVLETIDAADNLVDQVWGDKRPPVPAQPFRVHPLEYAGKTIQDKLAAIRAEMKTKKATMTVFPNLDEVAYLFNLRCQNDIATCPVGIAYAAVTLDQVTLYCDERKLVAEDVKEQLKDVALAPYDQIVNDIKEHCAADKRNNKVWLDASRSNYALVNTVPPLQLIDSQNAITPMKACKNKAELAGMRQAHIVDAVAMAKFMVWLQETVQQRSVSEVEVDTVLTGFRAQQPGFTEVSFPTIAGVGSNGAIVHYRAQEGSDLLKYLDTTQPILIDSGGQYTYGTTDVTRTWYFGTTPSPEFVDCYTRVLKGHIGLDQMIFPEDTPGFVLDVYARRWLWDAGRDYGHGTGHGVGAALNVHEGPISISPRWTNKEGLKKGMIVSNEPGYYEDGNFGIRIENLLEIRYVKDELNRQVEEEQEKTTDDEPPSTVKKYLKFVPLTMIPIQKSLINIDIMTDSELDWLDAYHATVWEKVSPHLEGPEKAWLETSCAKIDRKGR